MPKCKLVIRDEVNVRFEGLAPSTRRKLSDEVKYFLPHAYHMPAYKLGRWDGCVRFCDVGGRTYLHLLDRLLPIVMSDGYEVEVEDHRQSHQFDLKPVTTDTFSHIMWPPKHPAAGEPIQLRDYQVKAINTFLENPQSLQEIATGAGKCQPYYSKVLTPTGWTTMGEIQTGDLVTVPDGSSAKVIGVYEPGEKDVYELTFKDGRKVRSCDDHVWPVYCVNWKRSKTGPIRNITTRQIRAHLENNKCPIGIQPPSLENDSQDIDLPMDPWLLGFLLGDGCMRVGLEFSTADSQIVDRVQALLTEDYQVKHTGGYDYRIMFANRQLGKKRHGENISKLKRNHLGHLIENGTSANVYIQTLKHMGLHGKLSHEKFIPEIYFRGSKHQRLELIRGLVDSDGTIDKKSVYFTSTSKELSKGFAELIHSVGGIARIKHTTNRTYVYKGKRKPCRDTYTVITKYPTPWDLVSLARKKNLCGDSYQYGPTLKNNIVSVEKVGHEPVKCILIDHPDHLYITDGYMVTHNTLITAALSASVEPYGRSVVIVPNRSLVTQTEKDYRNMGLDVGVLYGDRKEYTCTHTIATWQSIESLVKDNKKGRRLEEMENLITDQIAVIVDECFAPGTNVLTPTGYVPIESLRPGDTVINYDQEAKLFKQDTVVKLHENLNNSASEKMYEITMDNNATICVTGNHKFLTDAGWVRADELTPEHNIIDIDK